ncbi:winged helix-turn-helix domain-containing protein [Kibdelosporangium philippinense]|uniref:Winged helix-turn-helix domain-containing protein n=1 Tax=Kibdelosporangium philippinense TaxID=211113 RepID=A0ABS8Z9B3_9PSEU|nr:winged helix-turn-helix domain-containing protein [Kibdelosporangium philippinense]MCE7004471.1 winged helix-turn-helix domain-containing protein [Kibdelosporangium philippinense]
MLRIHFTAADLMRIRIRTEPDPLWEVLLSLHMLQTGHGAIVFDGWRKEVRRVLRPSVSLLTALAPPTGYSPDFLTPDCDSADIDHGLERLLATSRDELHQDMARLAAGSPVPRWTSMLADGDAGVLQEVASAIKAYFTTAVLPYWPNIRTHIRTDRDKRADLATDRGFEKLLNTLHPTMRWRAPVLEVDYPVEQDLHLDGRGLVLIPSFFCWRNPIKSADPARAPVLVYPVDRDLSWPSGRDVDSIAPRPESLTALLGRTRAAVLRAIADMPLQNTSALAKSAGISLSGASQHVTVLRDAGLVVTHRHNGAAVHKLSARGALLLGDGRVAARRVWTGECP